MYQIKVQEQVQQVPLDSSSPLATKGQEQVHRATLHSTASAAQAVLEQVQQVSQRSTASAAQVVLEQVQQVSHHSTSSAAQVVLEQVPQMSQHSATHEVIEQSEKRGSSTVKRKRGRTQMPRVHGRSERKLVVLSDLNQPIGPTDEIVKELGSFLGTLARNSTFCPLNIHNWKKLNTKEDMWTYIKTKYDIHDDGREWVFQSIQNAWRRKKRRKLLRNHQVRTCLWQRDQEKPVEYTRNHMKIQCAKLLKWSKYKLKKVKMITNQLTHLQQSWDLNIQVA
ncbi:PREDICTED: uncharacterized protein LOC109213208 [Nicotiana attenuata]|uniref:uncharacterized protein LOC109213208 n=1 Tax=Nicotiana attenuata TaxID=49451 RepID=UPI000904FA72|nr:PREDICTED: uncharacterized protein LOC109213208 [Nicotiana attenuata]